MAVPVQLSAGQVLVYGLGTTTSSSGIQLIDGSTLRFGSIYQIWDGGEGLTIDTGTNVMFDEAKKVGTITYLNVPYTIVPARLCTKDQPLP